MSIDSAHEDTHTHTTARRTTEMHPKISVKGITLKEYFRLCGEEELKLNQIKEESGQSSKSSLIQTPSFPHQHSPHRERVKYRTEVSDSEGENLLHARHIELPATNRTPPLKNPRIKDYFHPQQHPQPRRRIFTKMPTQSTKHNLEALNRSTLGCFYQMEEKQRKMLRKVQADKDKAHEMTLREALSITKYGTKFNAE